MSDQLTQADPVTARCPSCGSEDLGTNFCETCGAPLRIAAAAASPEPPAVDIALPAVAASGPDPRHPAAPRGVAGRPRALVLGGLIVGAGTLALVSTIVAFEATGSAFATVTTGVVEVVAGLVVVAGVVMAGRATGASSAAKAGSIALAALSPALGLAWLIAVAAHLSNYNYAYEALSALYVFADIALLCGTTTFLGWAIASRLPGRSYRAVLFPALTFIPGSYLWGLLYISRIGALVAPLAALAAVVVAILIAPRLGAPSTRIRPTVAPAYGAPVAPGVPMAVEHTNGLAIAALVLGLVAGGILPVIFGHSARSQIRRTGERGWGMATAGLVLGYISLSASAIVLIVVIVAAVSRH